MKKIVILILIGLLLAVATVAVQAQTGSGYNLSWWTVDGGGSQNGIGGGYALSATAGQVDAGTANGGGYALTGGFWAGAAPTTYNNFLPTIVR